MLSSNVFYKVSLEATLRDKRACALWAQYFLTRETVTWNEFQQAFTDFFNIKARSVLPSFLHSLHFCALSHFLALRSSLFASLPSLFFDRVLVAWHRQGADANRLELVRVLVAKDRDMVGIEQFARALECFGPLETPAQFLDEIEVRFLSFVVVFILYLCSSFFVLLRLLRSSAQSDGA
jgi:hypothetical protein